MNKTVRTRVVPNRSGRELRPKRSVITTPQPLFVLRHIDASDYYVTIHTILGVFTTRALAEQVLKTKSGRRQGQYPGKLDTSDQYHFSIDEINADQPMDWQLE